MLVFKPKFDKVSPQEIEEDDDFFKTSHGLGLTSGGEFTLCGVACEEWNYTNFTKVKKITCKDCLALIEHCKTYKG